MAAQERRHSPPAAIAPSVGSVTGTRTPMSQLIQPLVAGESQNFSRGYRTGAACRAMRRPKT